MKDLIKNSLETINTTNDKHIYQITVQKVTKNLENLYNSNTVDKEELIELIKQTHHDSVKNTERFGYMSLEDELTEEKIKTMKCFGKLLDMVFDIKTKENTDKIQKLINTIKTSNDEKKFVSITEEIVKELQLFCDNEKITLPNLEQIYPEEVNKLLHIALMEIINKMLEFNLKYNEEQKDTLSKIFTSMKTILELEKH